MARQAAQQKSLEQTFLQLEKLLMTIISSFWRFLRVFAIIFFIKLSKDFNKDKFWGKQKTETFYIGTDPPLYRPSPTLLSIAAELLQVEMTAGETGDFFSISSVLQKTYSSRAKVMHVPHSTPTLQEISHRQVNGEQAQSFPPSLPTPIQ